MVSDTIAQHPARRAIHLIVGVVIAATPLACSNPTPPNPPSVNPGPAPQDSPGSGPVRTPGPQPKAPTSIVDVPRAPQLPAPTTTTSSEPTPMPTFEIAPSS
jgi:hypothetical protein